jgi:hypothetical protein
VDRSWIFDLSGLIASSAQDAPALEVALRSEDALFGINIATGEVTSGEQAVSQIRGSEATFKSLVKGELTLQAAYTAGSIELSGDPEALLRLSIVLQGACLASL